MRTVQAFFAPMANERYDTKKKRAHSCTTTIKSYPGIAQLDCVNLRKPRPQNTIAQCEGKRYDACTIFADRTLLNNAAGALPTTHCLTMTGLVQVTHYTHAHAHAHTNTHTHTHTHTRK